MTELRASVTRFRRSANFVMSLLRGPTPASRLDLAKKLLFLAIAERISQPRMLQILELKSRETDH